MEKYSKWRDPGSGIQPFLPSNRDTSEDFSTIYIFFNNLLGIPFGILKFILLLPVLLIWFLLGTIFALCRAPYSILRVVDVIFGRLVLVLLSFSFIEGRASAPKRMILRAAIPAVAKEFEGFSLHAEKSTAVSAADCVQPGDWIISNHSSYIDLFYSWYLYSSLIAIVEFNTGKVIPCYNRFFVFYHSISNWNYSPKEESLTTTSSTLSLSSTHHYPVSIFPEGVSSNGRGVLKFIADLTGATRNQRIHLINIKYSPLLFNPAHCSPCTGDGSFLVHLFRTCCQLKNILIARTILPTALFSSKFDLPSPTNPLQYNRTLQQIIAALGHMRPLSLQASDKISFLKSYHEHE